MDISSAPPIAQNRAADVTITLTQSGQSETEKAANNLKAAKGLDKIKHAAQEFEAVFLTEMLKPMFEGIDVEEPFGGGKGEEIFNDMMLQEYGKIIAKRGGIGIADQVQAEMIRIQGSQN